MNNNRLQIKVDHPTPQKKQLNVTNNTLAGYKVHLGVCVWFSIQVEIYDAAIKSCNAVLSVQPNNVKALFRKGKCFAAMGDVNSAIAAMKKALHYESDSKVGLCCVCSQLCHKLAALTDSVTCRREYW